MRIIFLIAIGATFGKQLPEVQNIEKSKKGLNKQFKIP